MLCMKWNPLRSKDFDLIKPVWNSESGILPQLIRQLMNGLS